MKLFYLFLAVLFVEIISYHQALSQNLKGQNTLFDGIDSYRLLIKFSEKSIVDVEDSKPLFVSSITSSSSHVHFINQFTYRQVIDFTPSEREMLRTNNVSVQHGKFNHFAFRGLAYLEEAETMNKHSILELANLFEAIPFVEYAAIEPIKPIEPPSFNTPDFSNKQHYRYARYDNDVYGIDIDYAWSIGIHGEGIKIADIEWGFDYKHEDLVSPNFIEYIPTTNHQSDDHGTSVAGILYSKKNGFGMTGMVHGAERLYGISEIPYGRPYGISKGLQVLDEGDVFVYEMQTFGYNNQYVPADYNQAVWDITKSATDAGIIIVAAAGNGNQNLDEAVYNAYRARGDNGAIIVGAGTKVGRAKASFSTYGSPVHLQGWGDWTVASTGYNDLYNGGSHAGYTNRFSGTSSATPIVASAVIAVQSYCKKVHHKILKPREMRKLLITTGTQQTSGGHIGPLPNVRRAIEALKR